MKDIILGKILFFFIKRKFPDSQFPDIRSRENWWLITGCDMLASGNFSLAVEIYKEVLRLNPKSVQAWVNKGISFGKLGKLQEAIKCFDKAIEINSKDEFAWENKGIILHRLNRIRDALECYHKVLEINPKNEHIMVIVAILEWQIGKISKHK